MSLLMGGISMNDITNFQSIRADLQMLGLIIVAPIICLLDVVKNLNK